MALLLAACSAADPEPPRPTARLVPEPTATAPPTRPVPPTEPARAAAPTPIAPETEAPTASGQLAPADVQPGYVSIGADGNPLVAGKAEFPFQRFMDLRFSAPPIWLVASAGADDHTLWLVVLEDGSRHLVRVFTDALVYELDPPPPSTAPPVLIASPGSDGLSGVVLPDGSRAVSPRLTPIPQLDSLAGSILPLPDTRVRADGNGRYLFLSDPTGDYAHGVLGDATEARGVALVDSDGRARRVVEIAPPAVIEGIGPLWVDWNGDGEREIIVTESDAAAGARLVLISEEGERLAEGPAIGQGGRWRHQLAVAPFGPAGERELAVVRTPHIGGVVEYYRWSDDRLEIVATLPGYSTHRIGSRNLEMAVAGDLDGDDRVELLVPTQGMDALAGLHRTSEGAEEEWRVVLPSRLNSNLAAVELSGGGIALGAGMEDGTLRLWLPLQ